MSTTIVPRNRTFTGPVPTVPKRTVSENAPTATNDATEGYSQFSLWLHSDSANEEVYICVDATEGSAIWRQITNA